jgi:oligopeptide transport system substrate-binding protein
MVFSLLRLLFRSCLRARSLRGRPPLGLAAPVDVAARLRAALLLGGLLVLGACGGEPTRVEQGNRDGVLHVGNGTEPQGLDPHVTTGMPESRIQDTLFEGLVSKDPATLEPVPAVAESWELSADGRTYRFHLRADARWSDGTPLTAEDFRWSWWRALQPAIGNEYAYMIFPIKNAEAYLTGKLTDFDQVGVRVIDAHTLDVELNEPTPYFLQIVDHHSYYPVPRHVIERFGAATDRFTPWTRPGNFVGNGAFTLREWRLNKLVRVEKNAQYWDAAAVKLNAVVFYPTENIVTEERLFRSGQLHATNDLPTDKIPDLRQRMPEQLRLDPYLGSYFYSLNIRRPGLDDVRVRQALSLAIDRDAIVDTVMKGVVKTAYSIVPPGTIGYEPPEDLIRFDPVEARRLLAEAGYPDGQGLPPLEILYNTHETHRKIAVAIQQMWKQHLNLDVTMLNQEWKVYLDTRENRDFTISRYAWIGDYVDPNTFLDMWTTDSGNNKTGWGNAEFDDLVLRQIPAMQSHAERLAGFRRAETILLQELPVLPIYIYATKHLVSPSVRGMPENIMDYISFKRVSLEQAD